jgi:RIO kinase 1
MGAQKDLSSDCHAAGSSDLYNAPPALRPQKDADDPAKHMKTPSALQPLIDDGIIDEVIRSLKSGKEATVYIVRSGTEHRCAKVYRDMAQRSFQQRSQYQEGRKVRSSRQTRAIGKKTRFGRKSEESAWKNAEVTALYQLTSAGVRVPRPYGYFNGVLIMELITDGTGHSAPRLGEVELSAQRACEYHEFLVHQIVRMLCAGVIHGDLSEYNVLVGREGPVIIDLPQAVNASGNNSALLLLERDVNNIRAALGRYAPKLLDTRFAEEIWALFEKGELSPDSKLTGHFLRNEATADLRGVVTAIDDARDEALRRQRGREELSARGGN